MIIVMKHGAKKKSIEDVLHYISEKNLKPVPLYGTERTVISVIGDERNIHNDAVLAMAEVEKVMDVLKKYKLAAREAHPEDTIINVHGVKIGGKKVVVMAGPCSVEDKWQIMRTAMAVKKAGAKALRGGAFKPRTSPYAFQGHGKHALKWLAEAREKQGLLFLTGVMDPRKCQ